MSSGAAFVAAILCLWMGRQARGFHALTLWIIGVGLLCVAWALWVGPL